jgi:hypothetical protein
VFVQIDNLVGLAFHVQETLDHTAVTAGVGRENSNVFSHSYTPFSVNFGVFELV